MNKKLLVFIFSSFLYACSNDHFLIPASEIPQWLYDRIIHDEEIMKTDPKSGLDITAWIRYQYNRSYYFEYHNLLWSSGPECYDSYGNKINMTYEVFLDYNAKKCCKQFVWKGPNYFGD